MTLSKIIISGYRGFSTQQSMSFGTPTGAAGSGLTIITGSNNSGKSSVLECLRARSGYQGVSFTAGTRNSKLDRVEIRFEINGKEEILSSITSGTSETHRTNPVADYEIFVLPSRCAFEPYFGKSERSRSDYLAAYGLPPQRTSTLPEFSSRLFKILKDPSDFNKVLARVLGFEPKWTIDQSDQGNYFLKFFQADHSHSSDGMGEGIVSLFAIVDALYDSTSGGSVVIDEPELSLHPALQKRLAGLILDYSKDRQVIISTHSPYFVLLESLTDGAHLVRVVNTPCSGTKIYELSTQSKQNIRSLVSSNMNNPHVLGLAAREIFFQEDGIILTEGQEDVLFYPVVADQIGAQLPGHLFGWGIGGASNMAMIALVLQDLGFKRVAGVLDADKADTIPALSTKFPEYFFSTIPAKDIRTKSSRKPTEGVEGLLDDKRRIRPEHIDDTKNLFKELHEFMNKP